MSCLGFFIAETAILSGIGGDGEGVLKLDCVAKRLGLGSVADCEASAKLLHSSMPPFPYL